MSLNNLVGVEREKHFYLNQNKSFERLNWTLEAERIRTAFGIPSACEFALFRTGVMSLCIKDCEKGHGDWAKIPLEDIEVRVHYSEGERTYYIGNNWTNYTRVSLDWADNLLEKPRYFPYSKELAEVLFNLGLLTTEVELALKASISHHERLELSLSRL